LNPARQLIGGRGSTATELVVERERRGEHSHRCRMVGEHEVTDGVQSGERSHGAFLSAQFDVESEVVSPVAAVGRRFPPPIAGV
jgi:hypothetical protein